MLVLTFKPQIISNLTRIKASSTFDCINLSILVTRRPPELVLAAAVDVRLTPEVPLMQSAIGSPVIVSAR